MPGIRSGRDGSGCPWLVHRAAFSFFFSLSFVLKFNPRMGQEGDVQRGGFRLDGPVTSRDKVGRRLCLLGSWWHTRAPSLRCGFVSPSLSSSLSLSLSVSLSSSLSVLESLSSPRLPLVSSWIAGCPPRILHPPLVGIEPSNRPRYKSLCFVFPSLPARVSPPPSKQGWEQPWTTMDL